MYQVKLTRGNHSEVYGTYASQGEAEQIADSHRATGYYDVEVSKV